MAEYRNRYLDMESPVTGTVSFFGVNPSSDTMSVGTYKNCEDYIGNREGVNPLSIREMVRFFPTLDGTNGAWEFHNYPIGYHSAYVPDPDSVYPLIDSVEREALAVDVLARTNPSRPAVMLPSAIGELKDLPSLIKQTGRGLFGAAAEANLKYRFGIAPMMNDIRKLTRFVDLSNQRFRELKKLQKHKAIRKRLSLEYEQVTSPPESVILHSQGAFITGSRQNVYTRKAWATVEWKLDPGSDIPSQSDDQLMKLARRTVTGVTTYGAAETAWELLPWSWLADWFGNVGEFIASRNNTVPCTWGRIAYMATTKGTAVIQIDPTSVPPGVALSGQIRMWVTRKRRYPLIPISPIPLPSLPILDLGKLSILASLATLRFAKS